MSAPRLMVCADPLRRRPARASCVRSIARSTVTRRSTSFGIALAVAREPKSAMRRTPGQRRAARTKEKAPRSNGRRGSATEGEGSRARCRRILLMQHPVRKRTSCALVFVEAGFVPNAIQFITYSPAYRPCARPKVSEAFSAAVPLGYRQIQDTFHGLVIHADQ